VCVQGGIIVVVDSTDLVKLVKQHRKTKEMLGEGEAPAVSASALAVGGIVSAVAAASNTSLTTQCELVMVLQELTKLTKAMVTMHASNMEVIEIKHAQMKYYVDEKDKELEARVSSLEAGVARDSKKLCTYWRMSEHPEMPKNIYGKDGRFSWKKTKEHRSVTKHGFSSIKAVADHMQAHDWGSQESE